MKGMIKIKNDKDIEVCFTNGDRITFNSPTEIVLTTGLYVLDADNGIGKSTFLSVLGLINSPQMSEGTLFLSKNCEIDYAYLYSSRGLGDQIKIRKNDMILITQEPFMLPLSIEENMLVLGLPEASRRIIMETLQKQFDNLTFNSQISSLSGGQVQRVFIEMMFGRIKDGEKYIVFIDEPFNNLSDYNKEILIDKIESYSKDNLIIMVEHSIPRKCFSENVDEVTESLTVDLKCYSKQPNPSKQKGLKIEIKRVKNKNVSSFLKSYKEVLNQ